MGQLYDKVIKVAEELDKKPQGISKEAMDKVAAAGASIAKELVIANHQQEEFLKKAMEALETVPEQDKVAAEKLMAYGSGMYEGEKIGRALGYEEGVEAAYSQYMSKFAQYYGEDKALEFHLAMKKEAGEDPEVEAQIEQIHEVAREAATEKLVEEAGGIEAVNQNPELAQEIASTADQAASIVVEQVLSGQDSEPDNGAAPAEPAAPPAP